MVQNKLLRIRPDRALLYGISFYVFMFVIAPVDIINKNTVSSVTYLIMGFLTLYLGARIGKRSKAENFNPTIRQLKYIYSVTMIFSVIAIFLRYYDLFFVRGFSAGLAAFASNMADMEDHSTTAISFFAAIIAAVPYLPVTLDMIYPKLNSRLVKIIAIVLFLMTGIGSMTTGSRFALINPLLYIVFIYLGTRAGKVITKKNVIIALLGSIGFLYFTSTLFIERLNVQNKSVFDASQSETGGYSDKVPAKSDVMYFMIEHQDNPMILGPTFGFLQSTQYTIHSVFEFPECKRYIDSHNRRTYGASTFGVFNKALNIAGLGVDQQYIESSNARPGIWSTFFYNWYLDFGWWGIPLVFLLGILFRYWWNKGASGNIFYIPISATCASIMLLSPQLNTICGTGAYALVDFFIFALWGTNVCRRSY